MNRRSTTAARTDPAAPPEIQHGAPRSIATDERLKRVLHRHPQRDEPRLDSVEPDETPSGRGSGGAPRALLPRWEHFDHGADVGVRGFAPSKAAAFEQAALALTAVVADPAGVAARETVEVNCEADDDELLLAAWLNAVVTEMALREMLFSRFHVELHERALRGVMVGEPVSPERHAPAVEVKGATYTELRVHQLPDGWWAAQTVVDV